MSALQERVGGVFDGGGKDPEGVFLDKFVESWNVEIGMDFSKIPVYC